MTAEQAERYLASSGFSEEQIKAVREAFEPQEATWLPDHDENGKAYWCSNCGAWVVVRHPFCAQCGYQMKR